MAEEAPKEATIRVILFELSGEIWGMDFKDIQEVLEVTEPTPIPKTPPFILGVINQRGRIITVIDFALLLGEREHKEQSKRIVHIRSDKGNVALLIRSKLLMDAIPERQVAAGRLVEKSVVLADACLQTRIVQKDKTEINLVDGEKIITLIGRYPFNAKS